MPWNAWHPSPVQGMPRIWPGYFLPCVARFLPLGQRFAPRGHACQSIFPKTFKNDVCLPQKRGDERGPLSLFISFFSNKKYYGMLGHPPKALNGLANYGDASKKCPCYGHAMDTRGCASSLRLPLGSVAQPQLWLSALLPLRAAALPRQRLHLSMRKFCSKILDHRSCGRCNRTVEAGIIVGQAG